MTTSDPEQRERLAYVTLVGLFLGLLGMFVSRERQERQAFDPRPRDIVLISLATFRAGRVTAFARVTEPFRDPVTETIPDQYDAGENVVAEGTGCARRSANWSRVRSALHLGGLGSRLRSAVRAGSHPARRRHPWCLRARRNAQRGNRGAVLEWSRGEEAVRLLTN